ncbi:MAG TPA: hypothetical protein VHE13_06330, partial [Opitutus sp.]|nr:hypothetical protein [Opitutus sp.]
GDRARPADHHRCTRRTTGVDGAITETRRLKSCRKNKTFGRCYKDEPRAGERAVNPFEKLEMLSGDVPYELRSLPARCL